MTLYRKRPPDYHLIGKVEASSDVVFSVAAARERALAEVKKQAARIGANGVIEWEVREILNPVSARNVRTGRPSSHLVKSIAVTGTAIYVASRK